MRATSNQRTELTKPAIAGGGAIGASLIRHEPARKRLLDRGGGFRGSVERARLSTRQRSDRGGSTDPQRNDCSSPRTRACRGASLYHASWPDRMASHDEAGSSGCPTVMNPEVTLSTTSNCRGASMQMMAASGLRSPSGILTSSPERMGSRSRVSGHSRLASGPGRNRRTSPLNRSDRFPSTTKST